ncbi:uncharacterized protein LOC141533484 [Cotesia typhae]|uniref:uncharacterized protein LOC141533484 n=1 Tax=Cotesia typhae TaxID=2053667 RepID=UPI003D691533
MTIFKVSRHDNPSLKKLVNAETIAELIEAAKVKLSFTENTYKIYMEDFTEIDDDEILQELSSNSKQLLLTVVPEDIEWNNDTISAKNTSTLSNTQAGSEEKPGTSTQPCQSSRQSSDIDNIFENLPSSVQKFLRAKKFLDYDKKKAIVHVVQEYMINDLHNTTRGVAINIGKKIVNAYPDSFTLEKLTSDAAGASLGQRIYDRINYVKQDQNNTERSQPCSLQDLDEPVKKPKAQDEYGCVAYMPELPQTENWESQEEKRLKLIEYYKSSKPVEDILELLSETYYLQRKNINREKRDLS